MKKLNTLAEAARTNDMTAMLAFWRAVEAILDNAEFAGLQKWAMKATTDEIIDAALDLCIAKTGSEITKVSIQQMLKVLGLEATFEEGTLEEDPCFTLVKKPEIAISFGDSYAVITRELQTKEWAVRFASDMTEARQLLLHAISSCY